MKTWQARIGRGWQIALAFFDMGISTATSYPLSFAMSAIQPLVPVVTFFFVAKLVSDSPAVGGDYYSFVMIGFLVTQALWGALGGFTLELQAAVQQGRLEMLLVEPVRWRLLPFGLAEWEIAIRLFFVGLAAVLSVALGGRFGWDRLPLAVLVFLLGLTASLAIGILSGAVGILTKRSNPVLTIYLLVAGLLAGVAFPIELLPAPLQALSWAIPHTYVISAIRRLLLPSPDSIVGPSVSQTLVALLTFNLVMYPLVLWAYNRIMETGRRLGVLSGY